MMPLKRTRTTSKLTDVNVLDLLSSSGYHRGEIDDFKRKVIKHADGSDASGLHVSPTMTFAAFKRFIRDLPVALPDRGEAAMLAYFQAFDVDGSGTVDMRETMLGLLAMDSKVARKHRKAEGTQATQALWHECQLQIAPSANSRDVRKAGNDPNTIVMKPGSFGTAIGTYPSETTGKWYYEVKIEDPRAEPQYGQVGFAMPNYKPPAWVGSLLGGVGDDTRGNSYCWDAKNKQTIHQGRNTNYGGWWDNQPWVKNDVVGCLLDHERDTISFSLNGKDKGVAYRNVKHMPMVPAGSFFNGPAKFIFEEAQMLHKAAVAPSAQCFSGYKTVQSFSSTYVDLDQGANQQLRLRLGFIFSIYDSDSNGVMSEEEFGYLIEHMLKQACKPSGIYEKRQAMRLVKRTPYGQFPMNKKAFYEVVKSGVFGQMGLHSSDLFKLQ